MTQYIVFHGAREGAISSSAKNDFSGAASAGLGDWFGTDNEEYASRYGKVTIYKIVINNPYFMSFIEFRFYDRGSSASFANSQSFKETLIKQGYDGIIVTHLDGVKEYILFDKKSAQKN